MKLFIIANKIVELYIMYYKSLVKKYLNNYKNSTDFRLNYDELLKSSYNK